jgi:hypothetical protein
LIYLRPILAIYGTGIAGTFAWLFFTLSGTSACMTGMGPCRIVAGLIGQLSLVWPAYWGGRISGNTTVTPLVPVEVVTVAVLVFIIVLLLAKSYTMISQSDSTPAESVPTKSIRAKSTLARSEPLIRTIEPNRRDQSQPARLFPGAQS